MRIAVYAFATTADFFRALIRATAAEPGLEWSVVLPRGHYRDRFRDILPADRLCYLYENFRERYVRHPSPDVFRYPPRAENIYLSLSKDKDGYRHLDKDEQLRRAATIYEIYKEFLQRVRPDYMIMPDLEVVDGFILLNLCYELGIEPICCLWPRLIDGLIFSGGANEDLPRYFGEFGPEDLRRAQALLETVRLKGLRAVGSIYAPPPGDEGAGMRNQPLLIRAPRSLWRSWTSERLHAGEDDVWQRMRRVIRPLLYRYRKLKFFLLHRHYFDIAPDLRGLPENFVFYALQHTPESSINGLAPYYVDQLRAVDRLLMALPNGYWLLVKEHPAMMGERPAAFYAALRKKPGVVLMHPRADSHRLVEMSRLVATVTGTVGMECFFLNKPCLTFGPTSYNHLCYTIEKWAGVRDFIRRIIEDFRPRSEEQKAIEIARLLNISYDLRLSAGMSRPSDLSPQTVEAFWRAVKTHIHRLGARGQGVAHAG